MELLRSFYMVKTHKQYVFKFNILIHTLVVYQRVFINWFCCTHYINTLVCETKSSFQHMNIKMKRKNGRSNSPALHFKFILMSFIVNPIKRNIRGFWAFYETISSHRHNFQLYDQVYVKLLWYHESVNDIPIVP